MKRGNVKPLTTNQEARASLAVELVLARNLKSLHAMKLPNFLDDAETHCILACLLEGLSDSTT
jgi:hypothetical protein